MFATLSTLDISIIAGYFVIVFLLAGWVTIQERRAKAKNYGSQDYFLGGKNLGWFVIGASLFASNIGSEHLVGLAGSGARGDMPAAQFELLASLILILLGWVFVPFYIKSGVFTMPEFLERRYSTGARNYLSIISILAYILTKISITIFAGALVFEVMGVPFWTGAMIVVIATGIYTIFGGLRAVIYTDMLQMFVLVGGSVAATFFGLRALGGWEGMMDSIQVASQASSELSEGRFFNLWRPSSDPDFPWTGILFGAPILGVWYWCTDQFIVQRVLSAKNVNNAREGTLFGGFLKILPLFIFVIPGVIAFALHQNSRINPDQVYPGAYSATATGVKEWVAVGGEYERYLMHNTVLINGTEYLELDYDPVKEEIKGPKVIYDSALPAMINFILPSGLRGLILAGLLAALMSSLSSVFNSCSTLFTIDFYKRWRSSSSERELVFVGQVATVVLVAISLAWIPFMRTMMEGSSFYQYLQSIQAYISPPIAAAFLLGLFIKRINSTGAIWSLWTGFILGIGRLLLEYQKNIGNIPEGTWLYSFADVNFLHFAIILFVICSAVLVLMSLLQPQHSAEKLKDVTYEKPEDRAKGFSPRNKDFWLTLILIAAILALWAIFSPLVMGR